MHGLGAISRIMAGLVWTLLLALLLTLTAGATQADDKDFGIYPSSGATDKIRLNKTYYMTFSTGDNGTEPYEFTTADTLPAGITLHPDGYFYGTPTEAGTFEMEIEVEDANGDTDETCFTIIVVPAPIANPFSETVEANSPGNLIWVQSSGTTASIQIASQPSHGTAFWDGAIYYAPDPGFSGTDTFTWTATSPEGGVSDPGLITITVTKPILALSPSSGANIDVTVGTAVSTTITASLGTAPYTYSVTAGSLPANLSLNTAGGFDGVPSSAVVGTTLNFTIEATDAYGATGTASYSMRVLDERPVAAASSANVDRNSSNNPIPLSLSGGSPTSLAIGTTAQHGTATVSGGSILYTPAANYYGEDSFSYTATNSGGTSQPATVTINVVAPDLALSPADGSDFAGALMVPFSRQLTATGGIAPYGFVTSDALPSGVTLGNDGLLSGAPAETGSFTFTVLATDPHGAEGEATYTLTIGTSPDVALVDALVQGFVETRLGLIAGAVNVPDLASRQGGSDLPVTTSISAYAGELSGEVSTSLAQIDAALNPGAAQLPFNAWLDGTFALFGNDGTGAAWGSFGMLSLGADYLLSEKVLIGLAVHLDRTSDPGDVGELVEGDGWLAGPYSSIELGDGVFWNSSLFYGGSANNVDVAAWSGSFTTERWLFDTAITGSWQLDELTTLTPKLRVAYLSETVADYTVENGPAIVDMSGFSEEQLRASIGATLARDFVLGDGTVLTPSLGVTGGFAALGGTGAFGSLTAGVAVATANDWQLDASVSASIEGDGSVAASASASAARRF